MNFLKKRDSQALLTELFLFENAKLLSLNLRNVGDYVSPKTQSLCLQVKDGFILPVIVIIYIFCIDFQMLYDYYLLNYILTIILHELYCLSYFIGQEVEVKRG